MRLLGTSFVLVLATLSTPAAAQYAFCGNDGTCSFPETCSTCPADCGSCDVLARVGQRAKYVDQTCPNAGDGLADSCAAAPGGAGRFNELQEALDSLVAGDTLFVHPGDYFREGEQYRVAGGGTADAPIIVTRAIPGDPPTIHSWDPAAPDDNARSHPALTGPDGPSSYVIVDGLRIDGLLALGGDHMQVQNVECTHGWEVCDGNWSCIRLEYCTDCVAHHNFVHDVVDTTDKCGGLDPGPREAGLKEFDGTRVIWEMNTVRDTVRWGYDLHRSSVDPVARYNLFQNTGDVGVRMNRSANIQAYGNVVVGVNTCIDFVPEDPGDGFANVIDHNTCLFSNTGFFANGASPTRATHNVNALLSPGATEAHNAVVSPPEDGVPHHVDRNAYDAASWWTEAMYQDDEQRTLAEWQAASGHDAASIAANGNACAFMVAPDDADDLTFDLRIAGGPCATLADDGGPIGACVAGACVGASCEACGGAPVDPSTSSTTATSGTASATGTGNGGTTGSGGPTGGAGAAGGSGGNAGDGGDEGGCVCAVGAPQSAFGSGAIVAAAALAAWRRRSRRLPAVRR